MMNNSIPAAQSEETLSIPESGNFEQGEPIVELKRLKLQM